jgi:transcriptional regulator with PAS, ATPase and Fis domain
MLTEFSERGLCRRGTEFSPQVLELFRRYNWPGNVRELRNIVERCINTCQWDIIAIEYVPKDIIDLMSSEKEQAKLNTNTDLIQYDKERLATLMRKYSGNKSKVAKDMGLSRGTLYKKLREYGWEV